MAVSKTKMTALVRAFAASDVDAALNDSPGAAGGAGRAGPQLAAPVLQRRRPRSRRADVAPSIRTAEVLLAHGLDIDEEAFTEDDWKATPLWFAVARGRNLALAEFLLDRGCNPNYALWAAAFNDDFAAHPLCSSHTAPTSRTPRCRTRRRSSPR